MENEKQLEETPEAVQNGNQNENEQTETVQQKSELEIANEKISELEKANQQIKDQLLRKAAEFENYKRRIENDTLALAKYAGEKTISQLLPVLDDLQRSLKSGKEKLADDPFYKGVEMIFNKFSKVLESQGLQPMESVGKEFNVDFHDALMQVPRADVPAHTILEEVEAGYLLHDKVLRHAKVIVATTPMQEEEVKS